MQGSKCLVKPETVGINPQRLDELRTRSRQEVDAGLLPAAQIALAKAGELVLFETWGEASNDSLFCIFSATKAITSAAAWLLIQEGSLDVSRKVSEFVPEFVSNGKQDIRIEQLFTHTAGFPHAPFRPTDWLDETRKRRRFADWQLNWQPGSRYEYHPTSSMWVIAEIIQVITRVSYESFVRESIALPLGLPDMWVGTPDEHHARIATITLVGEPLTEAEYEAAGLPVPPVTEVTPDAILNFNQPDTRRIPIPGGGGIMSAAELALFYQGLMGNSEPQLWTEATIAEASRPRTADLIDMMTGKLINRALGVVISGDKYRNFRGFGHTNSPAAFGHAGAGGQIAWADPASGISFAYCTNGHDQNPLRQGRRGVSISTRAAVCHQPSGHGTSGHGTSGHRTSGYKTSGHRTSGHGI